MCLEMEPRALAAWLRRLLDRIRACDSGEIFIGPVPLTEAPDYTDVVKRPINLYTMSCKIDAFGYNSLTQFQADFDIMINNYLGYYSGDTVFYNAILKMRDHGGALLKQAKVDLELTGLGQNADAEIFPSTSSGVSVKEAVSTEDQFSYPSHIVQQPKFECPLGYKATLRKYKEGLALAKRIKDREIRESRIKVLKKLIAETKGFWYTTRTKAEHAVEKFMRTHKELFGGESGSHQESTTDEEFPGIKILDSGTSSGSHQESTTDEEFPGIKLLDSGTSYESPNRGSSPSHKRFIDSSEPTLDEEKERMKKLKLKNSPTKGNASLSEGVNQRTCKAAGNAKSSNTHPSTASIRRSQKGSSSAQKDDSPLDQVNKDSFAIYRTGGTMKSDDDSQSDDNLDTTETKWSSHSSEESDHSDDTTDQTTRSLEKLDELQLN